MDNKVTYIYGDGGSRGNPGPAAYGFVVLNDGNEIYRQSEYIGVATNNVAEYQTVLSALEWIANNKAMTNETIVFKLDSELVVKQLLGIYKIKNERLKGFVIKIKKLQTEINKTIRFVNIPREENSFADGLVNQTLDKSKK